MINKIFSIVATLETQELVFLMEERMVAYFTMEIIRPLNDIEHTFLVLLYQWVTAPLKPHNYLGNL